MDITAIGIDPKYEDPKVSQAEEQSRLIPEFGAN